jgi:hypothetical protein
MVKHLKFDLLVLADVSLGPGVESTSDRNEYQEFSCGEKDGWPIRLTTSPPSMSRLSTNCGNLDV